MSKKKHKSFVQARKTYDPKEIARARRESKERDKEKAEYSKKKHRAFDDEREYDEN